MKRGHSCGRPRHPTRQHSEPENRSRLHPRLSPGRNSFRSLFQRSYHCFPGTTEAKNDSGSTLTRSTGSAKNMNSVRVGTCRITGINSCPWCTGGLSQRFRISPRDDIHIIGPGYISAATGRTASTGHGANADSIAAVTTGSPWLPITTPATPSEITSTGPCDKAATAV